jgi:hypothetical protein
MRRSLIAVLAGVCLLVCGQAEAKSHRHRLPIMHHDAPVQGPTPYAGPPAEDARTACDEQSGCHRKSGVPDFSAIERDRKSETSDLRWKEGSVVADVAPRLVDDAGDAPRAIAQSIERVGGYVIVRTREGAGRVVAWAGERFQGLIRDLEDAGYKIGGPGCLSGGHMRHSKHHWGGACDFFGQYARDRTRLRQPPPQLQIALARKHGLISGCMWRNRDCGHFEAPIPGQSVSQYMAARGYARRAKRYASR